MATNRAGLDWNARARRFSAIRGTTRMGTRTRRTLRTANQTKRLPKDPQGFRQEPRPKVRAQGTSQESVVFRHHPIQAIRLKRSKTQTTKRLAHCKHWPTLTVGKHILGTSVSGTAIFVQVGRGSASSFPWNKTTNEKLEFHVILGSGQWGPGRPVAVGGRAHSQPHWHVL